MPYWSTKFTKSCDVNPLNADLQKCMFSEMKLSGYTNSFVKLHLPPTDIKIFLPTLLDFSNIRTFLPRFAAVIADINPAAPAPRIITSY